MSAPSRPLERRRLFALTGLLAAPTLFLGVFFIAPLLIMFTYSWLTPGLYGGVEWTFSHLNYGRVLGWANTAYDKYDPVYISIFFRSVKLALATVLTSLVVCYPVAFWVAQMPTGAAQFLHLSHHAAVLHQPDRAPVCLGSHPAPDRFPQPGPDGARHH